MSASPAPALRGVIVARIGEGAFRGVFSGLSFVSIALLVRAWGAAETTPLWFAPNGLRWVLVMLMLPAFILFVAAVTKPNPTAIGGEARARRRAARHPARHPPPDAVVLRALGLRPPGGQRRHRRASSSSAPSW